MAASTQIAVSSTAPDTQHLMAQTDIAAAKVAIGAAWQTHKRSTLDFGLVCYGWALRLDKSKGGYGTNGAGLSEILNVLGIPRHVVDYAISVYKASIGQGIPCEHCTETFPSKTQLKKHQHNKHPELSQGTPRTPFIPSLPTRTDGSVDVHTVAIAEGCDYCRRHASCLQCPVHGPVLAKQLKDAPAVITDAVNFPDTNEAPSDEELQAMAEEAGEATAPLPKKEYAPSTRGSHKVLQELAAQVQAKYGEGTCSVMPMPDGSPINNGVVLLTIPVSVTRAQTLLKESL